MDVVLRTRTPEGTEVVLFAIVYAKILEEHSAVADLDLIDRTVREPDDRRPDPRDGRERFFRQEGDVWCLRWWTSLACLPSSSPCSRLSDSLPDMATATVHVSATDLELTGDYETTGDVLYLSAPDDDKGAAAQETPEGHVVRLDPAGRVTHVTAINARWLLDRDGELVATLRDGRRLRIGLSDLAALLG